MARDFGANRSLENGGILYVFPIFQTDKLGQEIRQLPQSIYSEIPYVNMPKKRVFSHCAAPFPNLHLVHNFSAPANQRFLNFTNPSCKIQNCRVILISLMKGAAIMAEGSILQQAHSLKQELITHRRWLHSHAEVGFDLPQTR